MKEKRGKMGLGMRREGEGAAKEEQHSARVVLEQKMWKRTRAKHRIKSKFAAVGKAQLRVWGSPAGLGRSRDHPIPPPTDPR